MADSSHRISLEQAVELTKRHRASAERTLGPWAFHVGEDIRELLAQPGVTGIRLYMGVKPDGSVTPVLVGIDAAGRDQTGSILLEESGPCPPWCDDQSPLMGRADA